MVRELRHGQKTTQWIRTHGNKYCKVWSSFISWQCVLFAEQGSPEDAIKKSHSPGAQNRIDMAQEEQMRNNKESPAPSAPLLPLLLLGLTQSRVLHKDLWCGHMLHGERNARPHPEPYSLLSNEHPHHTLLHLPMLAQWEWTQPQRLHWRWLWPLGSGKAGRKGSMHPKALTDLA